MFIDISQFPLETGDHCAVLDLRHSRPACTFFEKLEDGSGRLQLIRHYSKKPIAIFDDDYLVVILEDGEVLEGLEDYLPYIERDVEDNSELDSDEYDEDEYEEDDADDD